MASVSYQDISFTPVQLNPWARKTWLGKWLASHPLSLLVLVLWQISNCSRRACSYFYIFKITSKHAFIVILKIKFKVILNDQNFFLDNLWIKFELDESDFNYLKIIMFIQNQIVQYNKLFCHAIEIQPLAHVGVPFSSAKKLRDDVWSKKLIIIILDHCSLVIIVCA